MTRAMFFKHFELLAGHPDAGSSGILEGCEKLAGGKAPERSRHPRRASTMVPHPGRVPEIPHRHWHGCHPSRVENTFHNRSGAEGWGKRLEEWRTHQELNLKPSDP
jgi:hypothetical protein